jgi:integrase
MPTSRFDSDHISIAAVVRAYLAHLERQTKAGAFSPDHLDNVRRDLTRFQAFVGGDKIVSACRQHDLTSWLTSNPQWKSVSTRRNAIASVVSCFAFAEEEEMIDRCPYRRPRSLRNAVVEPRRPASVVEYLELFRNGSRPLRNALFFLWHTGARTCEMRAVRWDDIVFGAEPRIILFEHKTARKTGKPRIIALNAVVAKFLMWLKKRSKSQFVFVNCDGTPWDRHTFARHLRRTAERIGLDEGVEDRVSAYCLRHAYTCAALVAGLTTKQVADQLGHTDTTMVERVYGSHTTGDMRYLSNVADQIQKRRK